MLQAIHDHLEGRLPEPEFQATADDAVRLAVDAREFRGWPTRQVRHPAVFGPLGRSRPLTVHEVDFVKTLTNKPVKVALPGPYLLTRIMWMECISDRSYRASARRR